MKRFIKAAIVVLMLTAMPMKHWAQMPYSSYSQEGVTLDFFSIDNIDFRAFLLYNISMDDRFVLVPEEEYGQFVLTAKEDNSHFMEAFESFYQNLVADFALLTKNDIYVLMDEWKSAVAPQNFLSITMDLALRNSRSDNEHCANSLPFCTTDLIEFEAACTSQTANEPGMDDGCIGNSYNPSWYHMRIHTGGQFIIHMEGHDPDNIYQGRDIDFCMWGPYDEEQVSSGWACTHLSGDKIIDCCYSSDPTEDVYLGYDASAHHHSTSHETINYHLPEVGEYYILMITNYSRDPCVISFTKTPGSGPGETDCDILPGVASNDGPYCEGETIHLAVNQQPNATYLWTGPDGWTSTIPNPTRENCTMEMAGTYDIVTTIGTQSTPASTNVDIYQQPSPSFTALPVCQGEATNFEGIASGTNVAHYEWDFDDGETGSGQIISHTYAEAGTYQVTLTVTGENGTCPGDTTQMVVVYAMPQPTATAEPNIVIWGDASTLTGSAGVQGNTFTYHWEPADMVTNPDSPTTQTVPLHETTIYTLTVTNTEGGCSSTTQVAVSMEGSNLTAMVSAEDNQLCEDHSTTLHATPSGGTGNYTYSWEGPDGFTSTQQNPSVTPPVGTNTYTCQIGDGLVTQTASVDITVNPKHETSFSKTACDQFFWDPEGHNIVETDHDGNNYDNSGTFHRKYTNQYGCDSIVTLNLTINRSLSDTKEFSSRCDYVPFEWFGDSIYFEEDGIYEFPNTSYPNGQTIHGCDTSMTVTVTNMRYSPKPSSIYCKDDGAVVYGPDHDTIAVVTNTEFFSFQYVFRVEETEHTKCVWDNCEWAISKPSWDISFGDPEISNGYYGSECTVFVAEQDTSIVTLTATISNGCGREERKFYLKSSFLGIDENNSAADKVSIVPNPNNGQMRIDFEDLEGPTAVKVFDMTGNQIDSFKTTANIGRYSYDYTMKRHAQGIYFFVFTNNNRVFGKKVVIQ